MNPEKRIELTKRLNPEAIELARWVCLATRIDPALIRRARLRLMPGGNSGSESDLWFSPLIQTVGARYILFYPEVSNLLRRQLAGNRKDFARAWRVTRQTHRALPELVRLEEKLTWLALKDDARLERKLDALLRPLIKAILTGQRQGLGRWALNVVPHLPERARTSKSARLLRVIAESQLYGGWTNLLTTIGDGPTDEEAALLLHGLERTTAGLRLRGNSLEVSEPPEEGARLIKVPATNPRVLELSWTDDGEQRSARLMWKKGEPGRAASFRLPLSISTLAGDSHQLTDGNKIFDSHRQLAAPYLVSILDARSQPVGTGVLVENDFILTTVHSTRNTNPDSPDRLQNQAVGFPLQQPERIAQSRVAGSAPPSQGAISTDEAMSTDYPMLLKLHASASETHPAKLKSAFDLTGRVLLAPGMSPGSDVAKWAAFEVGKATETGDFALIPATQINADNLSWWSGAPLVDGSTGEVAGLVLVNKGDDARARVFSLDQISRAFPEIFNAGSKVLLSYSHGDYEHVREFTSWMPESASERIVYWDDSRINPETQWPEEVERSLELVTAVVLFISADYLASDFIVEDRLPEVLRRVEERGVVILPVILSSSLFLITPLARYQAVNDPSKPLATLSSQERDRVYEQLSEVLSKLLGGKIAKSSLSQPKVTIDFFISYHKADSAWAEWIAWQFEEAGYSTFLQSRDPVAGSNFGIEMNRARKESARIVALLSQDFFGSEFTQQEWTAALLNDPAGELPKLLSVRVRECELTGLWLSLNYIDLVGLSEKDATAALVAGIRRAHPKPVGTQEPAKRTIEHVPFPIPTPAPIPEPLPPLIPAFPIDVFISYAKLDNEPFGDEKGWVDQLLIHLTNRLGELLGRVPNIWLDTKLQGDQVVANQIGKHLSETCLFIPIVTPGYVNSKWCLDELNEFHRRAAETGGVRIDGRSRIFMVHKFPVSRESLPVELRELLAYEFYKLSNQGRPQQFGTEVGRNRDQRYWSKLDDLAWDIRTTLESIKSAGTATPQSDVTGASPWQREEAAARLRSHYEVQLTKVRSYRRNWAVPRCYVSRVDEQFEWATKLIKDLREAGVDVVEQAAQVQPDDFVVVLDTPAYQRAVISVAPVLAVDIPLVNARLGQRKLISLTLTGRTGSHEFEDCRPGSLYDETHYPVSLFDLVLNLYAIPFTHADFGPLRQALHTQWEQTLAQKRGDELTAPLTVFISYSHQDEEFKDELVTMLAGLHRRGIVDGWQSRQIEPGDEWNKSIQDAMDECDLVLLLVSAHYLASNFFQDAELPKLLQRREEMQLRVIPIIVRPSPWQSEPVLKNLQVLPKNGKPIITFSEATGDRDQVWTEIATAIEKHANALDS